MRKVAALSLAVVLTACAAPPPRLAAPPPSPPAAPPGAPDRLTLAAVSFAQLAGWRDDTQGAVLPALRRSCDRIAKLPIDRSIGFDGIGGTAADWYGPCSALSRVSEGDHDNVRAVVEAWFVPYLAGNNGNPDGLFTGYFEPEIRGSRQRRGRFTVPVLGKPADLVVMDLSRFGLQRLDGQVIARLSSGRLEPHPAAAELKGKRLPGDAVLVELARFRPDSAREQLVGRVVGERFEPYFSRAQIEAGAADPTARVLLWTDDPVDLHIMHIQGSGRVRLDDGTVVRLGVAGTNGHKFVGVGKLLREAGKIDDLSMPAIRAWLKANPEQGREVMGRNPRYVFYAVNAGEGPVGTEGVPLTPERSIAVDPRFVPLGVPLWLDTVDPTGRPLRRVMVAQDTGSAIKGPVRGDFFWGPGDQAFEMAGRMKSRGQYYLLLPRQRSPRVALD